MSAPTDRLVAEALAKSGLLWLTSDAGSAPCWYAVVDGVAYLVTGPGEQYSPEHSGRTAVVARAKESRARLVSFDAEASRVSPDDEDWDAATTALKAGRLNAPSGDLIARWRDECTIIRLVPDLASVDLRGHRLPAPVDTQDVGDVEQRTPGDIADGSADGGPGGPSRSAAVAAERENRAAQRADAAATDAGARASGAAGSGDDGGAAKVSP